VGHYGPLQPLEDQASGTEKASREIYCSAQAWIRIVIVPNGFKQCFVARFNEEAERIITARRSPSHPSGLRILVRAHGASR
jgi:hypothetical protein